MSAPKPQSGRLAEPSDLELFMDLQKWLDVTAPEALGVADAWAITNTDRAFAFNNWVGVQMSHEDNRWLRGDVPFFKNIFSPFQPIPRDFSLDGGGLYVYISKGPYIIMELADPTVETAVIEDVEETNTHHNKKQFQFSYTKTETQQTTLTVSETTSLKVSSSFELDGFSFGVEASFDKTNTKENQQSSSESTTLTESTTIAPHSKFRYKVSNETTTKLTLYGLDFSLGTEIPADGVVNGGIWKATHWEDHENIANLTNWNKSFPIEKFGTFTQTAKYHVSSKGMVTKIDTSDGRED